MKVCGSCKQKKPLSAFYKNSRNKDGIQSRCKHCQKLKRTTPLVSCIDCKQPLKVQRQMSLQCQNCHESMLARFKKNLREIDDTENRLDYLCRINKQFNLGYTTKQIRKMICEGYTDDVIVNKYNLSKIRSINGGELF